MNIFINFKNKLLKRKKRHIACQKSQDSFSRINLDNIRKYYKENKKSGPVQKHILLENLFEHPACNNKSHIINLLLSKKYSTKTTCLIEDEIEVHIKHIAKAYNVNNFISLYSIKNYYYYCKSLIWLLGSYGKLYFDKKKFLNVYIDKLNIADLIYDEYLRKTNLPHFEKFSFKLIHFILENITLYYRYKEIIRLLSITDIILSHGVYGRYGLIAKAAYAINKNINIYIAYGQAPLNLSIHKASQDYIRKPGIYEPELLDLLIKRYSKERLLNEYQNIMEQRTTSQDDNQIDLQFVYKNNEINTYEELSMHYTINHSRKHIFIFAHALVDNVRYTEWSLFPDYYDWIINTLKQLCTSSHSYNIFIKPHPSEHLYKCSVTVKDTVKKINEEYNANFIFLDKQVHNNLVFEYADLVITSCGTIGMEAPCYGVPVLVSSATLYEKANCIIQPRTQSEYYEYLKKIESFKKLDKKTIEDAQLCFVILSKYVYVNASFLRLSSIGNDVRRKTEYELYNKSYGTKIPLEKEELYQAFSFMIDNNLNDSIK